MSSTQKFHCRDARTPTFCILHNTCDFSWASKQSLQVAANSACILTNSLTLRDFGFQCVISYCYIFKMSTTGTETGSCRSARRSRSDAWRVLPSTGKSASAAWSKPFPRKITTRTTCMIWSTKEVFTIKIHMDHQYTEWLRIYSARNKYTKKQLSRI